MSFRRKEESRLRNSIIRDLAYRQAGTSFVGVTTLIQNSKYSNPKFQIPNTSSINYSCILLFCYSSIPPNLPLARSDGTCRAANSPLDPPELRNSKFQIVKFQIEKFQIPNPSPFNYSIIQLFKYSSIPLNLNLNLNLNLPPPLPSSSSTPALPYCVLQNLLMFW